jgi:hypothetical protein
MEENGRERPRKKRRENRKEQAKRDGKGKARGDGKAKAKKHDAEESERDDPKNAPDAAGENVPVSPSASTASRKLHARHDTSRASSALSDAPSSDCSWSPYSPALSRQTSSTHNPRMSPAPFFHKHKAVRRSRHTNRQSHSLLPHEGQQAQQPQPQKVAIQTKDRSKQPGPSQSTPSAQDRPTSSALVTRSNCRFHKISLLDGNDPFTERIYFIVPGCSLGDGELMAQLKIEDHGDATMEDSERMVVDFQDLGFTPDLLRKLRAVVGLNQEVFYLPRALPVMPVKSMTAYRAAAKSWLSSYLNDSSDGEARTPHPKRRRKASTSDISSNNFQTGGTRPPAGSLSARGRKRPLSMDAATYRPSPENDVESEMGSMAVEDHKRTKRKIKRAHTSEAADDNGSGEVGRQKKRKVHASGSRTISARNEQS